MLKTEDVIGKIIRFRDGHLLSGEELIKDDLFIKDGRILNAIDLFFSHKLQADIEIDITGCVLSPGLIDIQLNGAYGFDFSDPDQNQVQSCREVALKLPESGVTAFCPTIITSAPESYSKIIDSFKAYEKVRHVDRHLCASMLGLHLEGPFISPSRCGMHPPGRVRDFSPNVQQALADTYGKQLDSVSIVTLAPEIENGLEAVRHLTSHGICVSVGHTDTQLDSFELALEAGAKLVTHVFNAMPLFHHRDSHVFGSIVDSPTKPCVGMIADRLHVGSSAMRLANAMAPGRVILVTDANIALGLPTGLYHFGERDIQVTERGAYVAGTDCLAGGTTHLLKCVCNFWLEVTSRVSPPSPSTHRKVDDDLPPAWHGLGQALAAASTRPAQLLVEATKKGGVRGALLPGYEADLIVVRPLVDRLELQSTWIAGRPVFVA